MTRDYVATEIMGDWVFGLLSASDPTLEEACEELSITPAQFRRGLAFVKDQLADARTSPIVYDPKTYRYSLALAGTDEQTVKSYERYRLKIMAKQLRRLRTGTAEPAARLFEGNSTVRRFLRHLAGAEEELDILLSELDSQGR